MGFWHILGPKKFFAFVMLEKAGTPGDFAALVLGLKEAAVHGPAAEVEGQAKSKPKEGVLLSL